MLITFYVNETLEYILGVLLYKLNSNDMCGTEQLAIVGLIYARCKNIIVVAYLKRLCIDVSVFDQL